MFPGTICGEGTLLTEGPKVWVSILFLLDFFTVSFSILFLLDFLIGPRVAFVGGEEVGKTVMNASKTINGLVHLTRDSRA